MVVNDLGRTLAEDPVTPEGKIERSLTVTTIEVGQKLLNREVLVLPDILDSFRRHIQSQGEYNETVRMLTEHITAKQLHSQLTASLKHHVVYECKAKKYGTLVFRPGTDFGHSLAECLWLQRSQQKVEDNVVHKHLQSVKPENLSTENRVFSNMMDTLNDKIHEEIRKHLEGKDSFNYDKLDINEIINNTDKKIWDTIWLLTRSKAKKKQQIKSE